MQNNFYWLIYGVVSILIVASIIGWVLSKKIKTENGKTVVLNLNARIKAWWIMISIFSLSFFLGKTATIVLFFMISFFALREFITLTPTKPGDHKALSLTFFVLLPVQYYLISIGWYSLFAIFIPVYGFLLLPSLSAISQDPDQFLERTSKIQWAVMITIYCISHVPALLLLDIPGYKNQGPLLIFFLLTVVQLSDVFQYVFGKLLGKTKLAPAVSPSKTVEGLVGGGLTAIAVGTCMWWITPFTPLQATIMSSVIVVMGFLGGLVLSAVKRSLGAKDWGTMINGHGGMMDRMDSVCFAAPIFFHLTRYFFTN